jgi:hypothetical protein
MMLSQELDADELFVKVVVKVCDYIDGKKIVREPIIIESFFSEKKAVKLCVTLNQCTEFGDVYKVWRYKRFNL